MTQPPNHTDERSSSDKKGPYIPRTNIISKTLPKSTNLFQQPIDVLIDKAKELTPSDAEELILSPFDSSEQSHKDFPIFLKKYKQTPIQKLRKKTIEHGRAARRGVLDTGRNKEVNFSDFFKPSIKHLYIAHQNRGSHTDCAGTNSSLNEPPEVDDYIGSSDDQPLDLDRICEYFDNRLSHLRELYLKQREHFISTYKANNDLISEAFKTIKQLRGELYNRKNKGSQTNIPQYSANISTAEKNLDEEWEDLTNINDDLGGDTKKTSN